MKITQIDFHFWFFYCLILMTSSSFCIPLSAKIYRNYRGFLIFEIAYTLKSTLFVLCNFSLHFFNNTLFVRFLNLFIFIIIIKHKYQFASWFFFIIHMKFKPCTVLIYKLSNKLYICSAYSPLFKPSSKLCFPTFSKRC